MPVRATSHGLLLAGLALAGGLGCGPSPQPLPPPIDISISGLRVSEPSPGVVRLYGGEGTVPSAETLEVINITGVTMPTIERAEVTVEADGSFSLELEGTLTDQFRLQAFSALAVTPPVDVVGSLGGAVVEAPRIACLDANQPDEFEITTNVGVPNNQPLILSNNCDFGFLVPEAATLVSDGWLLDNTMILPADPLPGEELLFTIGFTPTVEGDETNVVIFRTRQEVQGIDVWRVFTVRGRALP